MINFSNFASTEALLIMCNLKTENVSGVASLQDEMSRRVLLLDGSTGVELLRLIPCAVNPDMLSVTHPELVARMHRSWLEAGADIIETNTFNSNRLSQSGYCNYGNIVQLNTVSTRLARVEADRFMRENPGKRCFVAGAMGPTAFSSSLSGNKAIDGCRAVDFDTLVDVFEEQAEGLIEGGADVILAETMYDLGNVRAAISGIGLACEKLHREVPYIASVSVSGKTGRMYSGHTLESFVAAMSDFSPLAIGMNCSDAPERINPYVRRLATFSSFPLIYYPNAGHPDETGNYGVTPQMFAESLGPLLADRLLNIVGGCCGTTTAHIRMLKAFLLNER